MNVVPVHSLSDPRVALYANMRDAELAQRADPLDERAHAGVFIAEGALVVQRLIESRFRTLSVLTTPARLRSLEAENVFHALPAETPVYLVEQELMNQIVGFNMHRGVLAIGERSAGAAAGASVDRFLASVEPLLILEDLTNHDNIGGIFRNCAALGGPNVGVALSPRCADPLYRKSLRVSMGAVLSVPFVRLDAWPEALAAVKPAGLCVLALTPSPDAQPLSGLAELVQGRRAAFLLGSEGPGLTQRAFACSDARVRIEMRVVGPGVDSLNVSVAAAIALHAWSLGRPPG